MVETKNILIIGRTGQGKSTIANVLINDEQNFTEEGIFQEHFKEGPYSVSQTKQIQVGEFIHKGFKYKIIDTPGIGDTDNKKMSLSKILRIIAKGCKEAKDGINQVLFVNGEKFTIEELYVYQVLKEVIFDEKITDFTTIIRSRFDLFLNSNRREEDIRKLIYSKNEKIVEMMNSCKGRVIHINNPSVNKDLGDDKIKINKKDRKESKEILLKHLENCQGCYFPNNLDNINKKIDDHLLEEHSKLKKDLEDVKEKLEKGNREENLSDKDKNLLEKQLEIISKLIDLNNEAMKKGFFEALGMKLDDLIDSDQIMRSLIEVLPAKACSIL